MAKVGVPVDPITMFNGVGDESVAFVGQLDNEIPPISNGIVLVAEICTSVHKNYHVIYVDGRIIMDSIHRMYFNCNVIVPEIVRSCQECRSLPTDFISRKLDTPCV